MFRENWEKLSAVDGNYLKGDREYSKKLKKNNISSFLNSVLNLIWKKLLADQQFENLPLTESQKQIIFSFSYFRKEEDNNKKKNCKSYFSAPSNHTIKYLIELNNSTSDQ